MRNLLTCKSNIFVVQVTRNNKVNYYKQLDIVEEELITKNEQDQIKFPNQKWYRTVTEMFFCFIYEILYIVVFWEENGPDFCQKFLKEMERSLI